MAAIEPKTPWPELGQNLWLARVRAEIKDHIPSLTDAAEAVITARYLAADEEGLDYADAAYRVCACGVTIDGFYEYVDHLAAVFGGGPSIHVEPDDEARSPDDEARRIETLESFADSNHDLYAQHVRGWFDADTVRAVLPSGDWGTVEG